MEPPSAQQPTSAIGANAPAVTIRLALESRPRILVDALSESEEARLADWLEQKPEYADLVAQAFALAAAA